MMTMNEVEDEQDVFKHPLYKEIHDRIYKKHRNICILICGNTGTGKSMLSLRIAEKLDPTFTRDNVKERVIVTATQFAQLISNKDDNRLQKGAVFVVDEIGAGAAGNREWYSVGNKMISVILQTFRTRQLIMIMTVPNMSFVDVAVRKLVDVLIETKKIDFNTNKTKARVWKLNYNKISGNSEPFRQRFRQKNEYGETVILDCMWFKRCDIKLANAYEKYANAFKQQMAEQAYANILRSQQKIDRKSNFDIDGIVNKIMGDKEKYYKPYGGGLILNKAMIEVDFGIGSARSKQVIERIKSLNENGKNISTHDI